MSALGKYEHTHHLRSSYSLLPSDRGPKNVARFAECHLPHSLYPLYVKFDASYIPELQRLFKSMQSNMLLLVQIYRLGVRHGDIRIVVKLSHLPRHHRP